MALTLTVDLPAEVEQQLRASTPDLASAAKEALLVSMYRQHKLSQVELSLALNADRPEVEAILHKHNVTEDLGTPDEYLDDARKLAHLLNRAR
ncbi:MAG TPA: UPF0175 family protein [Tepidisphaeraceae bacterium]